MEIKPPHLVGTLLCVTAVDLSQAPGRNHERWAGRGNILSVAFLSCVEAAHLSSPCSAVCSSAWATFPWQGLSEALRRATSPFFHFCTSHSPDTNLLDAGTWWLVRIPSLYNEGVARSAFPKPRHSGLRHICLPSCAYRLIVSLYIHSLYFPSLNL